MTDEEYEQLKERYEKETKRREALSEKQRKISQREREIRNLLDSLEAIRATAKHSGKYRVCHLVRREVELTTTSLKTAHIILTDGEIISLCDRKIKDLEGELARLEGSK